MRAGVLEPRLERDKELERRHEFFSHPLVLGGPRARAALRDPAWRRTVVTGWAVAAGWRSIAAGWRSIATSRRSIGSGRRAEAGLGRRRRGAERGRLRAGLEGGLRSGRFQRLAVQDRPLRRSPREFGWLPHDDLFNLLAALRGAGLAQ